MKEKTKKLVKRLSIIGGAIVSVLIVLAIVLSLTACSFNNSEQEVEVPEISVEMMNSERVSLSMTPFVASTMSEVMPTSNLYLTARLTATILPNDVIDKSVDWSVEWLENNIGDSAVVTDYVTVIPNSDGSHQAEVRCHRAFTDSVIAITCTTRNGGFTALCMAKYIGKPVELNIITNGEDWTYDSSWGKDIINLEVGSTYDYSLKLTDFFGNNSSNNFEPSFVIRGIAYGGINYQTKIYAPGGTLTETKLEEQRAGAINLYKYINGENVKLDNELYCGIKTDSASSPEGYTIGHTELHLKITGNTLSIESLAASSSKTHYGAGPGGSASGAFYSYLDGKKPYYEIKVKEMKTGVEQTILIRAVAKVESVALNSSELVF